MPCIATRRAGVPGRPAWRVNRTASLASERLALVASGQVRYRLKTPYRDGTTHIVLEPLDLMARLAALAHRARGGACPDRGQRLWQGGGGVSYGAREEFSVRLCVRRGVLASGLTGRGQSASRPG